MMKQKICLDTMQDIYNFVELVSKIEKNILLTDYEGHCVSAKSILGVAYSKLEWNNIYVICDEDISGSIMRWIV